MFRHVVDNQMTIRITSILFVATALIAFAPVQAGLVATYSESEISTQGISACFVPEEARPGDIVEFRVEMSRETWGRIKLQMPGQSRLRTIAEEEIPVSYADGLYLQRQSLLFQPVSSGPTVISGATVTVSTSDGNQTIELPELTLNVRPFENVDLSSSPLPLPPAESATQTNSMPFWIGVVMVVSVVALLTWFVFMRNRKTALQSTELRRDLSPTSDIVQQLRSGVIPKRDLEQLLNDPELSFSTELQNKIEQAVYSVQIKPNDLATLLQKELPA